jgi:hypothetical protein
MEKLLLGVGAMIVFALLSIFLIKAEERLPPQNVPKPKSKQKRKKYVKIIKY